MKNALYNAIYALLRPLLRVCFRKGLAFGEFSQILKRAYIDVAEQELLLRGEKASTSRLAIVTGLTRKDVAQLRKDGELNTAPSPRYNRVTRVLSGWINNPQFCDRAGRPAELERAGDAGSFDKLVEHYSGDMVAKAMLEELIRVGAVELSPDGRIRLVSDTFLSSGDDAESLHILGTDTGLLIATIDHNMSSEAGDRRFQRKVSYDNLPQECIPEFKQLAAEESYQLLLKLNHYLAQHDRDSNPDVAGSGRMRSGVGIYYFEEAIDSKTKTEST